MAGVVPLTAAGSSALASPQLRDRRFGEVFEPATAVATEPLVSQRVRLSYLAVQVA